MGLVEVEGVDHLLVVLEVGLLGLGWERGEFEVLDHFCDNSFEEAVGESKLEPPLIVDEFSEGDKEGEEFLLAKGGDERRVESRDFLDVVGELGCDFTIVFRELALGNHLSVRIRAGE